MFCVIGRESISPSLAGLAISHALSITQTLNWMVRQSAEVESKVVAVERLREYSCIDTEPSDESSQHIEQQWPQQVLSCYLFFGVVCVMCCCRLLLLSLVVVVVIVVVVVVVVVVEVVES